MWIKTTASFITIAIYLIISLGAYLIFSDKIHFISEKIRMSHRLRARYKEDYESSKFQRRASQLLLIGLGYDRSPTIFYVLPIAIFISTFVIGIRNLGVRPAFFVSISVSVLPILLLFIRISNIRRKGSYEGERVISEILREYRLNNLNIYETLEDVVNSDAEIKITRRLLSRLLYELRNTGNPVIIRIATDSFAYGIDTNWGRMLAHNIYIAAKEGSDVSRGIEDILIQLREARSIAEERKQLNNEAARMTYFMVPAIYLITILMSVRYLDIPLERLIYNQFATPEGFMLFYLIVFLFIGNIALIQLVTNQRFDY